MDIDLTLPYTLGDYDPLVGGPLFIDGMRDDMQPNVHDEVMMSGSSFLDLLKDGVETNINDECTGNTNDISNLGPLQSDGDGIRDDVQPNMHDQCDEDMNDVDNAQPICVEPRVGMQFCSYDELYNFYLKYSQQLGFPIRKRSTRKSTNGAVRSVTIVCGREGRRPSRSQNTLKPQPRMQSGCVAHLTALCSTNGEVTISVVKLDHNHGLSPSKSRLWRCNRKLPQHVKRRLEVNDAAGIPIHKSFNSAVVEAGGYDQLSFIEKDCRNYVEQVRKSKIGAGDAMAIQAFFSKMQAKSDGFFYSIDLDEESRLRNLFWADKRTRYAYKYFGDVVTFDTTYLTNKYDMPFAPFVGVNHHGQSVLLGCGLIGCEDSTSFVWLFKTWLECMGDIPPRGIITDQDQAMQKAISIVFPSTKHRWCLWHIMKKVPEKFSRSLARDMIFSMLNDLVYNMYDIFDFELGWQDMIKRCGLQENEWLQGLYMQENEWLSLYRQ